MSEANPYLTALRSEKAHTVVAEEFLTSESKVRRDRKKLAANRPVLPPEAFRDAGPQARILTLDIESRPHTAYVWGLFKQFVSTDQIIEPGRMMCFAAKWLGDDEISFYSEFHHGTRPMLGAIHELLSEADVVVTYNGDRYDLKRLNNEFYTAGLNKPKPYKSIDLFKQNKKHFDFPSRKLDYLAKVSGLGGKEDTGGFDLWVRCMAGDPEAWELMRQYNEHDVVLTEQVYLKMRPWLTNIPHLGMFTGEEFSCPNCGGTNLVWDGDYTHAFVQSYMLYECKDCGAWPRGNITKALPLRTRATR